MINTVFLVGCCDLLYLKHIQKQKERMIRMDTWQFAKLSQEKMEKLQEVERELGCVLIAYDEKKPLESADNRSLNN